MLEGIRRLDLRAVIGNKGNDSECRRLLDAIKGSRFRDFPASWSCRGMLPSLSPGTTSCADYWY